MLTVGYQVGNVVAIMVTSKLTGYSLADLIPADRGTLSQVARELHTNTPTVSRYVHRHRALPVAIAAQIAVLTHTVAIATMDGTFLFVPKGVFA